MKITLEKRIVWNGACFLVLVSLLNWQLLGSHVCCSLMEESVFVTVSRLLGCCPQLAITVRRWDSWSWWSAPWCGRWSWTDHRQLWGWWRTTSWWGRWREWELRGYGQSWHLPGWYLVSNALFLNTRFGVQFCHMHFVPRYIIRTYTYTYTYRYSTSQFHPRTVHKGPQKD